MQKILLPLLVCPLLLFAQNNDGNIATLIQSHRYEEAISMLEPKDRSLEEDYLLAKAYKQTGQYSAAIKLFEQLWKKDTTDEKLALALGESYYTRSQFIPSYHYFSRLTELDTANAYYHKLAGKTASKLAPLKGYSIYHFQKANQLAPKDRDVAYQLALTYFEFGQIPAAKSLTREFVIEDSTDLGMYALDTRLSYMLDKHDTVVNGVNYLIANGDTIPSLLRLFGVSLYKLERYDSALTWLHYLEKIAPSEQVYFYLGMANYRKENYDTAAAYLQKAIDETMSPNLGEFYTQLALALDKNKSYYAALDAYSKAYQLTEIHSFLFRMALINDEELRRHDRAKLLYQQFLEETEEKGNANERLYAEDRLQEYKTAEFMKTGE